MLILIFKVWGRDHETPCWDGMRLILVIRREVAQPKNIHILIAMKCDLCNSIKVIIFGFFYFFFWLESQLIYARSRLTYMDKLTQEAKLKLDTTIFFIQVFFLLLLRSLNFGIFECFRYFFCLYTFIIAFWSITTKWAARGVSMGVKEHSMSIISMWY